MSQDQPAREPFAPRIPGNAPGGAHDDERRKLGIGWIPLFQGADEASVNQALEECDVLTLAAGSPLLKPGELNQSVFILISGDVHAYLDSSFQQNAAIRIAAGECIGELSAIDGKPVSALVMATTEARVLQLPRDVFWNRLMAIPGVAGNLMVSLTERMRKTNEHALRSQKEQLEFLHLKKELDVARQLQVSMLPLHRPMFPDRSEIEICGFMQAASDVGGDLFDAFFVDETHLFVCIGDVSGHGIAAALFMARTIGLLRILAMDTRNPDDLLETLNDRLCIGNDTNLFVTMFCAYFDVETGELKYSNGGHCRPVLVSGGAGQLLPVPKGVLIGALPGMKYSAMEFQLNSGDLLFCYTDGVTEAQSLQGDEFSEAGCLGALEAMAGFPLPEILDSIRHQVALFTGSEALDDDCTMLAFRHSSAA